MRGRDRPLRWCLTNSRSTRQADRRTYSASRKVAKLCRLTSQTIHVISQNSNHSRPCATKSASVRVGPSDGQNTWPVATSKLIINDNVPWRLYSNSWRATVPGRGGRSGANRFRAWRASIHRCSRCAGRLGSFGSGAIDGAHLSDLRVAVGVCGLGKPIPQTAAGRPGRIDGREEVRRHQRSGHRRAFDHPPRHVLRPLRRQYELFASYSRDWFRKALRER